ncbi:Uncharacterised protein [Mycobacterium tuberculosis]|nr:Uncharacterised protein [Mycobacterium tuberculosis]CNU70867.1 Uncharacterised protein [Mycobacterium tuberculosis]
MKLTTTRDIDGESPSSLTIATSTPGAMNPVLVANTSSPISAARYGRPARARLLTSTASGTACS